MYRKISTLSACDKTSRVAKSQYESVAVLRSNIAEDPSITKTDKEIFIKPLDNYLKSLNCVDRIDEGSSVGDLLSSPLTWLAVGGAGGFWLRGELDEQLENCFREYSNKLLEKIEAKLCE